MGALMLAACTDSTAPPPPAKLAFTVQPSDAMAGVAISPAVTVAIQDAVGHTVRSATAVVSLAIRANPGGATLLGTTAVNAVNGVATFSDLAIEQVSAGYTLTATSGDLVGASSVPFAIAQPIASLHITAGTGGSPSDPDGYAACVDPGSDGHGGTACAYGGPQAIGVNGAVTVTVDTGAHAVLLTGVAANCTVAGDNPRAVQASRGQTAGVPFAIACVQPSLHVTTATTGVSLDPDGYDVCVDLHYDWDFNLVCSYASAIGVNGGVTVPVALGTHVVELGGVADNCQLDSYSRSVEAGGPREVPFVITCVATGSVQVTTATSGTDLNPEGYLVCVDRSGTDCSWQRRARANDVITIDRVFSGPHTVKLTDIGGNCTVSGGTARAVTVPADGTVNAAFNVSCVRAERIAFSNSGTIGVVHSDGTALRWITDGFAPAWSPDGARVAYECGQDICAINADSTGSARLTSDGAANHHPTWSPDGLKIAFASNRAGVADLYVMAANGSGVVRLSQGIGFLGSPAWSPDGTKIAFDCQVDPDNVDICVVQADGTGFARLTSDPARDYGAAWKPDGSTLAFATTRFGLDVIVLMSPAGGSVTGIGAGLPGFEPNWSPDGTQLAFVQLHTNSSFQPYNAVVVAHTDGSNVRIVARGDQPAWQPHP